MSWLFLFCNVFIVDLQLFEICLVAKDVLWQILNRIFRQIPENFKGKCIRTFRKFRKNNISRNVILTKRRQYEETTAEDHALVSSELKGEGKAEREREREREMWEKVY